MSLLQMWRKLTERIRGHEEEKAEEEPDPDGGNLERLDALLSPVKQNLPNPKAVLEQGVERVRVVRDQTTEWIAGGAGAAQQLAGYARQRIEEAWKPEDSARVIADSPLFQPLPEESAEVPPELVSLRWRNEALLGLSAAGVLSLEDEVIPFTDQLFHKGLRTPQLSERLFGRSYGELHEWIDTVPGSGGPGGGPTHRVKHGHDLEAAATIYEEHGLEGVLVWMQHVGQDAFSITGVPLPIGGKGLHRSLVEHGEDWNQVEAAYLVSFNAVELAASFLAGAFAIRVAALLQEVKTRRKVQKRCAAALRARERGDLDAVIANYAEARSLSDDPTLSLALGWAYRETGRPAAESFLAFRRAAQQMGTGDRMIEFNGVTVSLRGLAYLLALVEAPQILQLDDLKGAWRSELNRMVTGAVSSFERAAISQFDRPGVEIRGRNFEWRPRPLSAAANYYLAARASTAVPFVSPPAHVSRHLSNALEMLERAEGEASDELDNRLSGVGMRWQLELAEDSVSGAND